MRKGKPIEPGCLAIIVGAKNCQEDVGRVVHVLRQPASKYEPVPGQKTKVMPWPKDTWFIEALPGHPDLTAATVGSESRELLRKYKTRVKAASQKNLIRLDDGEEPKTVSTAHTKDLDQVI